MSNVEKNVVDLEIVNEQKATLREAMRAACLHEEGTQRLKKAGDGVSGVLWKQAREVHANALQKAAELKQELKPEVIKGLFFESLLDAEKSQKEESSPFKHQQKLPRCWINAKSVLGAYLEYGKCDWEVHTTVSKCKTFNKEEKEAREKEEVRKALEAAGGMSLVPPKQADAGDDEPASAPVITAPDDGLDSEVRQRIEELVTLAADLEPHRVVKLLNGTINQLTAMQKKALAKLAS